jgi:ABC-type multidrug transport system fused ATPase/permease subunit
MTRLKAAWAPYGELFSRRARVKLGIATVGSLVVSLIETAAIALLFPLIQILSGADMEQGVLGWLHRLLGQPAKIPFVLTLMSGVLGGFIVKDVFSLAFRWWMLGFIGREQVATSTRMLRYFLNAPYSVFLQRSVPDMLQTISNAVGMFYMSTVGGTMTLVVESFTMLTILGALFLTSPLITLILVLYFGGIGVLFAKIVRPRAKRAGEDQMHAATIAYASMTQALGGIEEIKIRHAQEFYLFRYRDAATRGVLAGRVGTTLGEAPRYLLEILFILGLGGVIMFTQTLGSPDALVATLAVMAAAAFRMLPSLTRLLGSVTQIRSGESARTLLFEELEREKAYTTAEPKGGCEGQLDFRHELRFENVSFMFDDGHEPVLDDVSFAVSPGSRVAIVGGSGAGKTTVAKLLMGLHTPSSGRITVDGVDIGSERCRWQNNLAFVPQDIYLMDLPLCENIAFDHLRADINWDAMEQAVELAHLGDLVRSLPQGLDTMIGERGVRLSGGQRQRLGLARALYRGASVLILDEATSALDNATERRISETLSGLPSEITTIVIAHRLSTVKDADQIILLNSGKVAGTGTFTELAHRNTEFAELVALGSLQLDDDVAVPLDDQGRLR